MGNSLSRSIPVEQIHFQPAYLLLLTPLFFRRGRKYSYVVLFTAAVFLRAMLSRLPILGRLFPRTHPDWALSQEVIVGMLKTALRSLPPDILRSLFVVFGWITRTFQSPGGISTAPVESEGFKAVWIYRRQDRHLVQSLQTRARNIAESPDSPTAQATGHQTSLRSLFVALRKTAKRQRQKVRSKLSDGAKKLSRVAKDTFRMGSNRIPTPSNGQDLLDEELENVFVITYLHGNSTMWLPFHAGLLKHLNKHHSEQERKFLMLSVDYSLSPDAKWPQALKEVLSAHQWLTQQCRIPSDQIIFMGDSAGGNLATAAALAIRDEVFEVVLRPRSQDDRNHGNLAEEEEREEEKEVDGEGDDLEGEVIGFLDPPRALILISPWLDLNNRGASFHTNSAYDFLNQKSLSQAAADYLQGEQSSNPLCSPLFADDVQGLPHILCFSGEKELFCDDIRLFMDRVRSSCDSKTQILHVEEPAMIHNYPLLGPGGFRQASLRTKQHISNFLARILLE